MPIRHGIYRKLIYGTPGCRLGEDEISVFRNGIWQIFSALKTSSQTQDEAERAVRLEFHFRETSQRFLYSVQHLNVLAQEMAAEFSRRRMSMRAMSLELQAGCHADHILTYLSSIVDDIACAIARTVGYSTSEPISMGELKGNRFMSDQASKPVATLIRELDNAASWWELAFKRKVGGRQLLIHNHHFVSFQGCLTPGSPAEVDAYLTTPFSKTPLLHFFNLLHDILASLFDWLDRLEVALTAHLQATSAWVPNPKCPRIPLPVGYPPGTTVLNPNYFVLPLCDGSDPLPWTAIGASEPSSQEPLVRLS
jgi:hypothetical protein